jgi:heme O synthase-like polyprenyltransferase
MEQNVVTLFLNFFFEKIAQKKNNKNPKNMFLTSLHHLQRLFLCIWLLTHSFSKKSKYKKKEKNQNLQRDQI